MSSRTPFRSHLLQQWTQQARRPPVAAIPWLRSDSKYPPPIVEWRIQSAEESNDLGHHRSRGKSALAGDRRVGNNPVTSLRDNNMSFLPLSSTTWSNGDNTQTFRSVTSVESKAGGISSCKDLHTVLLTRRTASKPLVYSCALEPDGAELDEEMDTIRRAIDRAVMAAQMAPNHKRTEPFTFKRFWAFSTSALRLADICYHVTLRKKSEAVAQKKREKWARIPVFVVALVHNNQDPELASEITTDATNDPYAQLKYSPPLTERQLEDYASTSAAVQNILLSLHADGIATKWATGPVIHTSAFRQLVQAKDSDRIVALVMVGGQNSVEFEDEREERRTRRRRHRRRGLYGDVLLDLP